MVPDCLGIVTGMRTMKVRYRYFQCPAFSRFFGSRALLPQLPV